MSLTNVQKLPDIPLFAIARVLEELRSDPNKSLNAKTFACVFRCSERRSHRMPRELARCKSSEVEKGKLIELLECKAAEVMQGRQKSQAGKLGALIAPAQIRNGDTVVQRSLPASGSEALQ